MSGDTEQDIFQEATAPEPAEKPAAGAEIPTDTGAEKPADTGGGPARDPETGKFVGKSGTEQPKPAEPAAKPAAAEPGKPPGEPQPSGDHRIPLAEHLSEREKRQSAEREVAEYRRHVEQLSRRLEQLERPREQQKPPDPWADPGAHAEYVARQQVDPIARQQELQRDDFSRMLAEEKHGPEVVNAAFAALEAAVQSDPTMRAEASRIWQQRHPYGALIAWHKREQALREIGNDPAVYKTKLRDEFLKDPEFRKAVIEAIKAETTGQQPAQNGSRPRSVTQLPPSLNRLTSAAPVNPPDGQDLTDAELFREATARR